MPKEAKSRRAILKEWISKFPEGIFTTDGKIIFCQACIQEVQCSVFSHLKQHSDTAKHQSNVDCNRQSTSKQQLLTTSFAKSEDDPFNEELCDALIAANIPFIKLNNPSFKQFLTKYCNRIIPDESTIRKNYLKICYDQTISRIKQNIANSYVWCSVDETTDSMGRYVANLIVGKLHPNGFSTPFLASVKFLEQTNHSTIARFVNDGIRELGIKEENVLLLVTDAAAYMLKAGRALNVFFPNLIHITCVCHALNRVAEQVRAFFPAVDQLIASTKKVFVKAPSRVSLYKQMCPNLPIPPAPILTRWLEAANFFTQNFSSIKNVITQLDSDDAVAIQKAKEAFEHPIVQQQLAYINANFGTIPMTITKLEAQGLTLVECLDILLDLRGTIRTATGDIGSEVHQKFEKVFENNPGLSRMLDIAKVLCGGVAEIQMAPDMMAALKFAPMNSCDVERSFSLYKNVLSDRRTCFTPENLEMYLVCNCEKR